MKSYLVLFLITTRVIDRVKFKVPVNNIFSHVWTLPEGVREKIIMGQPKRPHPHRKLPQVKQISSCRQAKYERATSLNP